jgi:hypothetical protein
VKGKDRSTILQGRIPDAKKASKKKLEVMQGTIII